MYSHKNGVTFRKADSADLPFLQEMKGENWWGTRSVAIINDYDQRKWFDNLPGNCLVLIGQISVRGEIISQQYVGYCIISEIDWIARIASISGAVHERMRSPEKSRQAFEAGLDFAFEMLNMHRLDAEVAEYHYPASKIEIDALGFKVEGLKKQSIYKCGRYYNSLMLGMLRSDWENHPRVKTMGGSCCTNFDHHKANIMINRANREQSINI